MNKTELQKELAKKLREVIELETRIKDMPDDPGCMPMTEKPEMGQVFYCITGDQLVFHYNWGNDEFDNRCFATGNCYATKETAERAQQRKKLKFREYQAAMKSWEGEKIDWKNNNQRKFFIFFNYLYDSPCVEGTYLTQHEDAVFKTKESAKKFMESLTKDKQRLLWERC